MNVGLLKHGRNSYFFLNYIAKDKPDGVGNAVCWLCVRQVVECAGQRSGERGAPYTQCLQDFRVYGTLFPNTTILTKLDRYYVLMPTTDYLANFKLSLQS